MTTMSSPTTPRSSLADKLTIVTVKPGLKFSKADLMDLLPDVETALFFGKVYELDYQQLSNLLSVVLNSDLAKALFHGAAEHSSDLQDYIVDDLDIPDWVEQGEINFSPDVPHGEILPQMWEQLEVEVAASIKAVAEKLAGVVNHMPGKQGQMVFQSMRVMNAKRPVLGDFKAKVHHAPVKENLVILDVSGSMNEHTVHTIVDDVVALSYLANAHLAIVSDACTYWAPGSYGSDDVTDAATFGGTHYETLAPLFDRDWGTVVTIADYDSSYSAKSVLARCTGHIDEVLDISLVNQPTYLAECVGQLADKVRPLLVGNSQYVLSDY